MSSLRDATDAPLRGQGWAARGLVLAVVLVGFAVRFYQLETPSLWWNEMLVAMLGQHDIPYILEWTRICEIHPPYLYIFTKGVEQLGMSDFALRLFPALAGAATVFVAYRCFRDIFNHNVGLLAAAALATNHLHIFLSRQLRPYSFLLLAFILALHALVKYLETNDRRYLFRIFFFNVILCLLSYINFLLMACETALVLFVLLMRRKPWLGRTTVFGALCGLAALPVIQQFLSRSRLVYDAETFHNAYANIARTSLENLAAMFTLYGPGWFLAICAGLALIGAVRLLRADPPRGVLLAGLVVLPLLILIAFRYGYDFRTWNAVFLMPMTLTFYALGAEALARNRVAIALVAVGVMAVQGYASVYEHADQYYGERGGIEGGSLKTDAKRIVPFLGEGELTALQGASNLNAYSWYIDQFSARNRLLDQEVRVGDGPITVNLFRENDHPRAFLGGAPVDETPLVQGTVLRKYRIDRRPGIPFGPVPAELSLGCDAESLYGQFHSLKNVMPVVGRHPMVVVTRTEREAGLEYLLEAAAFTGPQQITVHSRFENEGAGNRVELLYRFDQEPWRRVTLCDQPAGLEERVVSLHRWTPYATLGLRYALFVADRTPGYPGGSQVRLSLDGTRISAKSLGGNLFDPATLDQALVVRGLRQIESESADRRWRWALGPETTLEFEAPPGPASLRFALCNIIAGQRVEVLINDEPILSLSDLPSSPWLTNTVERVVPYQPRPGKNTVTFRYGLWNGSGATVSQTDASPYSLLFTGLSLY